MIASKLAKFRNNPEAFFADSRHGFVRGIGRVLAPRLVASELAMALLEDPREVLGQNRVKLLVELARLDRAWSRRRRHALLEGSGMPTVSVIVAAHQAADTIGRSIRSLLSQTYPELEVVVVDDASTDGTAAVVEEMMSASDQIALRRNPTTRGAAAARNVGLAAANGAYLTFQDADDISHPERIERQLAELLARPSSVVCVCNFRRELPDGARVIVNGRRFGKSYISMLFPRRPVFDRLGYMMDYPIYEDSEYLERIRAVFGREREVHLFQTLYRAQFSPSSLLFANSSTTVQSESEVTYGRTREGDRILEMALERLKQIREGELDPFVPLADST